MIIKYLKQKDIEKSGYAFTQIIGEKADGSQYTKDFFANDADLGAQLAEFAPGEFLNLSYDTSKYKNLKSIAGANGFPAQSSSSGGKAGTKTQTNNNNNGGNFRGDDTNRASAVYLAKEVVFKCLPKSLNNDEILDSIIANANVIFKYITEGRNLIEEAIVKSELEVPDIED